MKKKSNIFFVDGEKIFLAMPNATGKLDLKYNYTIEEFLSCDKEFEPFPGMTSSIPINLLVVPDYWISKKSYKFNSKNRTVIESFIKRKIKLKDWKISESKNFFEYELYHTDSAEQFLQVYFFNEAKFFLIYEKFLSFNIQPGKITSYAFLWQQKLNTISNFGQSETGFIHLGKDECFLYFYSKGKFIFSRNIKLAAATDISKSLNLLTYEINQSLHLFAQQSKKNIDRFYLLSDNRQNVILLSQKLDIEVLAAEFNIPEESVTQGDAGNLTPFTFFNPADFDPFGSLLCITHKDVKSAEKWEIVLKTGVIVGIFFFLLMIGEAVYISKASRFQSQNQETQSSITQEEIINNFSEALDKLSTEFNRADYRNMIIKIIESIPANIRISEIKIETDTVQQVNLKGVVKASDHSELQDILSVFLSGLKKNIKPAAVLSLDDINIKNFKNSIMEKYKFYNFKFSFNLS